MKYSHGVILTVALVGIFLTGMRLHFSYPASPIGLANFERIKSGMTESEVIQVLGRPAGDYSTGTLLADIPLDEIPNEYNPVDFAELVVAFRNTWDIFSPQAGIKKEWISDKGIITIHLDEAGLVIATDFLPVHRKPDISSK